MNVYVGTSAPDDVAVDFARNYFSSSQYVKIEFAALIFYMDGRYYPSIADGFLPHQSSPFDTTRPVNVRIQAAVHTHPQTPAVFRERFSPEDISVAETNDVDLYVADLSYKVYRYYYSTNDQTDITTFVTRSLTNEEKDELEVKYRSAWEGHIAIDDETGKKYCESERSFCNENIETWPSCE